MLRARFVRVRVRALRVTTDGLATGLIFSLCYGPGISLSQPTAGANKQPARRLRGSRSGHHEVAEDGDENFISAPNHKARKVTL